MKNINTLLTNGERVIAQGQLSERSARYDKLLGILTAIGGVIFILASVSIILNNHTKSDMKPICYIFIVAGFAIYWLGMLIVARGIIKSKKTGIIVTNRRIIGETADIFKPNSVVSIDNSVSGISGVRYETDPMDSKFGCATIEVTLASATYKFRAIENYEEICNALKRSA